MNTRIVSINGIDISVVEQSKGDEWVVCLHGIQSCKEMFLPLFSQSFIQDYSLLAIDAVGFGDSKKPKDFSYDLQDQMLIIKEVIETMDIKSMHVIGHSMGGMIGTMLLKELNEKIRSFLNLEGNFVLEDCGKSREVANQSLEDFESSGFDLLKNNIANSNHVNAKNRFQWINLVPAFVFYKTAVSIVDYSETEALLSEFIEADQRKIFIYGDSNQKKADVLPDKISKQAIKNAGHFMMSDNPKATYASIDKFINKS